MPNWEAFHQNIGNIGLGLGEWAKEQIGREKALELYQKQKDIEFQKALALEEAKMRMEQENPVYQFLEQGKIAQALKTRADLGEDISRFAGIFGEQPSGVMPSGIMDVSPQDYTSAPIVPIGTQDISGDLYAPEFEITPFGKVKPKGGVLKSRKVEEETLKRKIEETKQLELAKGIPTSEAGRVALAEESIKNIQDVKRILFPTGEASSYRRWTAYGSNPILNWLPGVPQFFPYRQNPQDVYRKMSAALSGRQLIQTGVAARPEETARLVSQFAPTGIAQSQSTLKGLEELENFYKNYIDIVKNKGLNEADKWAKSQPILDKRKQGIPDYNPTTQKLQRNQKTGEYRVINK